MKPGIVILIAILLLIILFWIGLKIQPSPFPAFGKQQSELRTMPLPAGLPAPVERFYKATYGEQIPVIETAVISGRGTMAPLGFALPMRFRFIYEVGKNYRSLIDATLFNIPVMKAQEYDVNGQARGKMPYGIDEGEWFDQAINVRVWCEILTWFPAALLNDPRVSWQPIDDSTAMLVLPFGEKEEHVVVRFDPETGKVLHFEAMKYRKAGEQVLWIDATWMDQGKRWIVLNVEDMLFNVDVQEEIQAALQQ